MPVSNQIFSNNALTVITVPISDTETSISVLDGISFTEPTSTEYELITLNDGNNIEVVKVTSRNVNIFTVVREHEGTATSFGVGTRVHGSTTKGFLDNIVHGRFELEDSVKIDGMEYVPLADNDFGDANSFIAAKYSCREHTFTSPPVCLGENAWQQGTDYPQGSVITPTSYNNYSYYAKTTGLSSSVEPTWSTTPYEETLEGSMTWVCIDPYSCTITMPANSYFIPTELGFLGQHDMASATTQPYVTFGIVGTTAKWLASTQTTFLTGAYAGQKFDPINTEGADVFVAVLNTKGDGATIGRYYWKGICIQYA